MPIQVGEIVTDPDLAQPFVVTRSTGQFVLGGWQENPPATIQMYGVVSVANEQDLEAIPEGDRVRGAMVFHAIQEIFTTHEDTSSGTSDIITWNNEQYRVVSIAPYKDYGYYRATAVRMKGA